MLKPITMAQQFLSVEDIRLLFEGIPSWELKDTWLFYDCKDGHIGIEIDRLKLSAKYEGHFTIIKDGTWITVYKKTGSFHVSVLS